MHRHLSLDLADDWSRVSIKEQKRSRNHLPVSGAYLEMALGG
jgi:hypothetical protein